MMRAAEHYAVATPADADVFGMWVFIATEVMMFGGLFMALLVDRVVHPGAAAEAARHFHMWLGALNTAVLLTSSLTMAIAATAERVKARGAMILNLVMTALLGVVFLGIKGIEYTSEFHDGLGPSLIPGPHLNDPSAMLFVNLYFVATGLHAFHLLLGIGFVLLTAALSGRNRGKRMFSARIVGLYWHFVDVVWIFLYPILYLVGQGVR